MQLIKPEWHVIEQIAKGNTHPQSIAKKLGTSVSSIIQKLKVLEAYGLVKKYKESTSEGNHKKRIVYKLAEDFAIVAIATQGNAGISFLKPLKKDDKLLIAFLQTPNIREPVIKALCREQHLLKASSIGFVSLTNENLELLVVMQTPEQVEKIKTLCQGIVINTHQGERKLLLHVHTKQEIKQGLEKNDLHFVGLIDVVKPVIDDGFLNQIKKWKQTKQTK